MDIVGLLLIFGLSLCVPKIEILEASHHCGIRQHSLIHLFHHAWKADEGQWPWHVALFHRKARNFTEYACGGTLIGEKHILTAAHCVMNHVTGYPLKPARLELHFGQLDLTKTTAHTQIRDVRKVHVNPHGNDVAVLVTRLAVSYTDFVSPICMDQREDKDVQNLEGKRGYISGWGTTQNGVFSDVLRTASMPVVSHVNCFDDDPVLFGNILTENVFCAGDRNGTSPGLGDSGGGMYFKVDDRWVLKGIVSFAKADEMKKEVDTSKYAVFVNVQRFLKWIRDILDESKQEAAVGPKRKSEEECDRFRSLAEKNAFGTCANDRHPHTVSIVDRIGGSVCDGALVNEFHVLTSCLCIEFITYLLKEKKENLTLKVKFEQHGLVSVEKITCHPKFRKFTHDLAVVKLRSSIKLSKNLIPACLASNSTENLYDTLLQTGFQIERNGDKKYLESEKIKVINHEECPEGSGQLCTTSTDRSRAGDPFPGSPLQSANSHTCMYTIVGLASDWKDLRNVNNTVPYKYTRISHYLDWIEKIVWNVKPPIDDGSSNGPTKRLTKLNNFNTSG